MNLIFFCHALKTTRDTCNTDRKRESWSTTGSLTWPISSTKFSRISIPAWSTGRRQGNWRDRSGFKTVVAGPYHELKTNRINLSSNPGLNARSWVGESPSVKRVLRRSTTQCFKWGTARISHRNVNGDFRFDMCVLPFNGQLPSVLLAGASGGWYAEVFILIFKETVYLYVLFDFIYESNKHKHTL